MAVMTRPDYVIAVTQNSPGKLERGVQSVLLRGTRSGKRGNKSEGSEAVARYQKQGTEDGANWLIDYDGTIYELTGWDRAAWNSPNNFVIAVAQPTPNEAVTEDQYEALHWLMYQLEIRKGVPRKRRVSGLEGYSNALGPGFSMSRVGL